MFPYKNANATKAVTMKSSARATSDVRKTDSKRISSYQSQSVAKPASAGITKKTKNPAARRPSTMRRKRGLSGASERGRKPADGKVIVPSTWHTGGAAREPALQN